MNREQQLSIQIQKSDIDFLKALEQIPEVDFTALQTSSFDGQSEIITLLVTISPLIIAQIGKILSEQLKARRYVKIVYKGTQIQGMTDKDATRVLEMLIKDKNDDGD